VWPRTIVQTCVVHLLRNSFRYASRKDWSQIACTTNAIESINARIRRAVNARGHFPTEQAALKCIYLAVMRLDPTGKGRKRWSNRWKAALNAFQITFDERLSPAQTLKQETTPVTPNN
jgi:transposase-like protein